MIVAIEALRMHHSTGRRAPAATEPADPAIGRVEDLTEGLRRVEGQVRAIRRLVRHRQYYLDVLTELAEARASLRGLERAVLRARLESALPTGERRGPAIGQDDMASEEEIRPTGTFDGSRAMEVAVLVRDRPDRRLLLDFSDVRGFEPFGVEVLLRELPRPAQDARIRCSGVPPCLADAMRELGIVVAPTEKAPRWAPWAWRSAGDVLDRGWGRPRR